MKHPLLFMLLAGGALFGAGQVRSPAPDVRVVTVEHDQTEDDAILLAEAYRLGWHETDPIVIGHLVQTMGFARPDVPDAARLMELAHATGLSRTDHMVHARLKQRMEDTLKAGVPDPTEAQLRAWRQAHLEDYRQHDAIAFTQRIVPHGAGLPSDPDATQPMPAGMRQAESGNLPRLMSLYGEAFVEALPRQAGDGWVGPIPGPHGDHWLQVTEFTPGDVPELSAIRNKVAADWRRAEQEALFAGRMDDLRAQWQVISAEALVQREEAP